MSAGNPDTYRLGIVVAEYSDSRPGKTPHTVISSMHRNRIMDEIHRFTAKAGDATGTSVVALSSKVDSIADLAISLLRVAVDEAHSDRSRVGVTVRIGVGFGEVVFSGGMVRGAIVQRLRRAIGRLPPNTVGVSAPILEYLLESVRRDARPLKQDADSAGMMPLWVLPIREDANPSTQHSPPTARADQAFFTEIKLVIKGRTQMISPSQCPLLIGREANAQIMLSGPTASRQHGRIEYDSGKFYYVDESTNGSYVLTNTGSEVFIKKERFFLHGHGAISPGVPVSEQSNEVIRFDASPRTLNLMDGERSTTQRFS